MTASSFIVQLEDDIRKRLGSLGTAQAQSERIQQEMLEDTKRWENYVLTGKTIAHNDMKNWLHALGESLI